MPTKNDRVAFPQKMLFDLANDPNESNNLAGTEDLEDVQAELEQRLKRWWDPQRDTE